MAEMKSSPWLTIPAVIGIIAVAGLFTVMGVMWLRPHEDNYVLITAILAFLGVVLNLFKTQEVHDLTNSRMTELSQNLEKVAFNKGMTEGVSQERTRRRKSIPN